MTYRVIVAGHLRDLVAQVNDAILDGWKLQGGVAIDNWRGYAQAMTKPDPLP